MRAGFTFGNTRERDNFVQSLQETGDFDVKRFAPGSVGSGARCIAHGAHIGLGNADFTLYWDTTGEAVFFQTGEASAVTAQQFRAIMMRIHQVAQNTHNFVGPSGDGF